MDDWRHMIVGYCYERLRVRKKSDGPIVSPMGTESIEFATGIHCPSPKIAVNIAGQNHPIVGTHRHVRDGRLVSAIAPFGMDRLSGRNIPERDAVSPIRRDPSAIRRKRQRPFRRSGELANDLARLQFPLAHTIVVAAKKSPAVRRELQPSRELSRRFQ